MGKEIQGECNWWVMLSLFINLTGGINVKKLVFITLLSLLCAYVWADGLEVTSEDVTIRFPDAAEPDSVWCSIEISNVSYWDGPVGVHHDKARVKVPQTWEGLLQEDEPELGKVQFTFIIKDLPNIAGKSAKARRMELCFRVRQVVDGVVKAIGAFSEPNFVTMIGKPGLPNQQ